MFVDSLDLLMEQQLRYYEGLAVHSNNVARYSKLLAEELGLSDYEVSLVYEAGLVHDYGKICVPLSILLKHNSLDNLEYSCIKVHPAVGSYILRNYTENDELLNIVARHHERIDGLGYPMGLKELSITEQIVGICDVFDAISSDRPYKHKRSIENTLYSISMECERGVFNKELVEALHNVFSSNTIHNSA